MSFYLLSVLSFLGSCNKTLFHCDLERRHDYTQAPLAHIKWKKVNWFPLDLHYKYKLAPDIPSLVPASARSFNDETLCTHWGVKPRTEIVKRSIAFRGSKLWNHLDDSLTNKDSNTFKRSVKRLLDDMCHLKQISSLRVKTTSSFTDDVINENF